MYNNLLSPADLLEWQITHYTKRLATEIRPEGRKFLQTQLNHLTNKKNPNGRPIYICSRNIRRTTNNGLSRSINQL